MKRQKATKLAKERKASRVEVPPASSLWGASSAVVFPAGFLADTAGLAPQIFLSIIDLYRKHVERWVGEDGRSSEETTYFDRTTGKKVGRRSEEFDRHGRLKRREEEWFQPDGSSHKRVDKYDDDGDLVERVDSVEVNGVPSSATVEDYEKGKLKSKAWMKWKGNFHMILFIEEVYDSAGRVIRKEEGGPDKWPNSVTTYSFDSQGRLRRIEVRDGDGKVVSVTVIQYFLDGSKTVTITDYSTTPATVTTQQYAPNGTPK
jgi:hypothetical protein